jgi:hypothetical protein
MSTMNRTGIVAGRKMDSAALLAYPNPEALLHQHLAA